MAFDLVIKGGTVVDGTGLPGCRTDVRTWIQANRVAISSGCGWRRPHYSEVFTGIVAVPIMATECQTSMH
jgi:hypothetical protein